MSIQKDCFDLPVENNNKKYFDTLKNIQEFEFNKKSIHEIFQEQVYKNPNKEAVSFNGTTLTYSELNEKSNQLARFIRKGYKKKNESDLNNDTFVSIMFDKSIEMIVAILGVLKAGAAYVPIEPNDPLDRIQYLLHDVNAEFVLTQSNLVRKITTAYNNIGDPKISKTFESDYIITLDDAPYLLEDKQDLVVNSKPSDLAYVIYTSGTTGKPKGVMIEQQCVQNLAISRRTDFSISEASVVLQFSPVTFDASVCEIFSALLNGAKLSIINDQTKRDPYLLCQYLVTEKITVATILPSLLSQLMLINRPMFPDLETLIVAGEPCTNDVMLEWSKNCRLINAYGPSEATVCATVHQFKNGDLPSTIGLPILNVFTYVLDENLCPVTTPGMTGELYIGGAGLARGYLNRPELTEQRFINNIFSTISDKSKGYNKLYKTGDIVRRLDNGNIEYIGRNDFQVKIRGHRVELGELENTLLTYSGVKQVCVLAKNRPSNHSVRDASTPENSASKYLIVYYVSKQEIKKDDFIDFLSQALPSYMIPSYFVWMEAFPVTSNGKVNRGALPDPEIHPKGEVVDSPVSRTEFEIRSIWESVLSIKGIGTKDDFFTIGGNSLLVISLAATLNKVFGTKVNVSSLFLYRTIQAQSELILKTVSGVKGFEPVTTFRSTGKKPALFFIHPSMTGAELYMKMINWLDKDQPFYGVESYNFNNLDTPETNLLSLARRYVEYIKAIQPSGPYVLGGYSLGGNIAYEIAHQLVDSGEKVDGLYLIDSVLPDPLAKKNGVTYEDAKNFLEYFEFKDTTSKHLLELAKVEMSLLFSYLPKAKLPIKIVLIKATKLFSPLDDLSNDHIANHFFQVDRPYSGWDKYADEVNRYVIDANHETIVEPEHLEKVSRIIQKNINIPEIIEMHNSWS